MINVAVGVILASFPTAIILFILLVKERKKNKTLKFDIVSLQGENIRLQYYERVVRENEHIHEETRQIREIHNALQRQIEGYEIEFFLPGIGLLDELADEFKHTEAGQRLKMERNNAKSIFKSGKATISDDNSPNGKKRSYFFADYFDGKVDEILSRVKHDNYGKLAQEIQDITVIVNKNIEVFPKIQISELYLKARLEELKWATIVHELKLKEREEQKAIQEQIREEAKVQKEIEKAKKEAAKEAAEAAKAEAIAQKLYDEFKAKFDAMSEKEKALHAQELADQEAKLAEAEERIRLAEEKGQRALSMAQQTKQGHVYVISNIGSFGENVYKIGMTRRLEPEERVRELGDASVPFPFDIHGMIHFDDAPAAESQLHRLFLMGQVNKTNSRKEFFRADLKDIKSAVEKIGGNAHWTMLAEAAQYRETLHIEDRIKNDAGYRKEWEERQVRLENLAPFYFEEGE